jgi:hypothetical protein
MNEVDELIEIIESWGPEHEAWDRIADGLMESDPVADILDRTARLTSKTFASRIDV